MNVEGFTNFGKERGFSEEIIAVALETVKDFESFLKETKRDAKTAIEEDIHNYAHELIKLGKNQKETYYGLIRYCYFSGNDEMLITLYISSS